MAKRRTKHEKQQYKRPPSRDKRHNDNFSGLDNSGDIKNHAHQVQGSGNHIFSVTPHPESAFIIPHIDIVRACIKGSIFVKRMPELLPHPSQIDTSSEAQQARYQMYLAGAEYDNFPRTTMLSMLGKMKIEDMSFDLPDKLEYLEEDADGDNTSLKGMIDACARNVLQAKWHVLLADYNGMSDLDLESTSTAQLEEANPRASIKQYRRENVVDWHFARRHGRMQLDYLILKEVGEEFAPSSVGRTQIDSYLILGIDDIGYYQAKIVNVIEGEYQTGEKNYPKINGKPLQFIPAEVVCDEEFTSGAMPQELGYLSLLTDLALSRYRVSADYKEALESLKPTVNVFGINSSEWEQFKGTNGRDYIASGAYTPNIWSNESAKMELMESSQSLEQFEKYFERNEKKVRALGGVFETDKTGMRTATEVINEAEGQSAILAPTVGSIEAGLRRMVLYCGMFEGVWAKDNLVDNIDKFELYLPRDFAVRKLSVEEAKELREQYLAGLLPKEELYKVLEIGGWTISSADELIAMSVDNSDMPKPNAPQPKPTDNQGQSTNNTKTKPPQSDEAAQ